MPDLLSIAVSDLTRSTAFHEAVLSPLGHARLVERSGPGRQRMEG